MKHLEKLIRQIAHNERATVVPGHVTGFEQFLKEKKRRRHRGILFWIGGTGLLVAATIVFIVISQWLTLEAVDSPPTAQTQELKDLSENLENTTGILADTDVSSTVDLSSGVREESAGNSVVDVTPLESVGTIARVTAAETVESQLPTPYSDISDSASASVEIPVGTALTNDKLAQVPVTPEDAANELQTFELQTISSLESALHPLPRRSITSLQPEFQKEQRLSFGVHSGWFPVVPEKNTLSTGMAYQGGLFASYVLSPRVEVRLGGGFTLIDGGAVFKKEASSQELLFRAQARMSTLEARQFYAYHGGLTAMYRFGRHRLSMGAQMLHIYAAKGDIELITEGVDGSSTTDVQEGTWVAISGLNRNPVDLTVGYHLRFTDVLEIGLSARIPASHFGATRNRDNGYLYSSNTYQTAPQITLHYFIR